MDRRGFLGVAAAVAGTVAGAGAAVPAIAGTSSRPVALWEELGGFVPAGYLQLRPPQLAVYGDGLVVADAAEYRRLRRGALNEFVDFAASVLRNPDNGVKRPGSPVVADVPATKFTARRGGRTWSISAEGLAVLREQRAFPRPLYDLLDEFTDLRDWALRGHPFAPAAIRLVTMRVEQPPATPVPPWPADVPVPIPPPDQFSGSVDLYGRSARAAVRAIPHANSHRDAWTFTTYRAPNGRYLAAGWRRLLPHE
ncbi:hypothetical protein [Virgisporangium aurantiacum]|uniref:Tat (Twin-arginine translocation) pathway signal sequence n=1 Tax=Virgisporangium aurantiacum TaxID=175570 RepID=A0A8J3ZFQ0_9ACTN|nr:hypothetical protein [Virgisporangium aurantiacum]GIJ60755.1 hypothetical protein Vau01_082710 [Virgisporangium aurantiacum]